MAGAVMVPAILIIVAFIPREKPDRISAYLSGRFHEV